MAYATPTDMVRRFGQQEMIRLSVPAGEDMDAVVVATVEAALDDASAVMDSYLRAQVATPLAAPPREVGLYCCDVARHILATGDGRTPGEDVRARHDAAIRWLRDVAAGQVRIDVPERDTGEESFAMVRDRAAPFGAGGPL